MTAIVLELNERVLTHNSTDIVYRTVSALRHEGIAVTLDNFGTGDASLSALVRYPADILKIDRSFVTGCDRDENQQRLILAILALADRMGLETVAEGVETAAEHAFVAQIGCSHAQGYAIARPMPLAETFGFLAGRAATARELPVLSRRAG